ncbi:MAG: hypothetical protein MMC33_005373 [Icmadophila ericetorum]|nr:hypothetical protein [Icmadophila ericetorum]
MAVKHSFQSLLLIFSTFTFTNAASVHFGRDTATTSEEYLEQALDIVERSPAVLERRAKAATPSDLPPPWSYGGCWVDNAYGRILATESADNTTMTIESCVGACKAAGYSIAGIEYSTQCFCGNNVIQNGTLASADSDCAMTCGGNQNEICGGPNLMSIYNSSTIVVLAPPVAQTTALPGSWTYSGCITEANNNGRVFPYQIILANNNTATNCLSQCSTFGYPAGGMEYGRECYCGDVSDLAAAGSVSAPESDCSTPCTGNASYLCGGGDRISYYTWTGTPFTNWATPTGAAAGEYQFLIGGVVVPLMTTQGINGKVTFLEKWGTGPPNTTGAYELDLAQINNFTGAWRPMHVRTDVFCSAGLVLPDKAGRVINIGGWSGTSTFGIRLYTPSGSPGVWGNTDWEENAAELHLQAGRWYPSAMVLSNGSVVIMGGENGSNGPPVPSLEVLPQPPGGTTVYLDFLNQTDPYNLYPFQLVLPSGQMFVGYYNQARLLDQKTFQTTKILPTVPGSVNNPASGRSYPFEGAVALMPLIAPYTTPATVMMCGGSNPGPAIALDNCVSIQPGITNPKWVLERMPSQRVMPCISVLPDGTYLITNGAHQGVAGFGLASSPNLNAVLYDPTKAVGSRFSIMANTIVARLYHSESLLLQDGRVLISGSDPEDDVNPQEYRVEVFLPPYLLSGKTKPTFTPPLAKFWTYGAKYKMTNVVLKNGGPPKVSLIGAESSTHGNNMGTRAIFPAVTCSGGTCTITAPPNSYVAPPGWYHLFLLDGPTPSNSTWVQIGGDPAQLGNWPNFPDFTRPGV